MLHDRNEHFRLEDFGKVKADTNGWNYFISQLSESRHVDSHLLLLFSSQLLIPCRVGESSIPLGREACSVPRELGSYWFAE